MRLSLIQLFCFKEYLLTDLQIINLFVVKHI